jgi:molybdenum cofactor synthesis domain-containing protein
VVLDERPAIEAALTQWCEPAVAGDPASAPCNIVLTTGGTGFAPRDVTPEATLAVLHRPAPALTNALLCASFKQGMQFAALSRAVAGLRNRTLIINLPGRPKACRENLALLMPLLGHAAEQLAGDREEKGGDL